MNLLFIILSIFLQHSGITIENPWIRNSSTGTNTAFFFTVNNAGKEADTLYAAYGDFAEVTEVHETYKKGEDMMGMREVPIVVIPPGSKVVFKPRDLHVMLIKLTSDVEKVMEKEVILKFRKAGEIKIKAPVKGMEAMIMQHK